MSEVFKFDDENRSVAINEPFVPQPWINYLSNDTLHAFVSQAGGGFCWYKSAVVNRVTRYRHYNLPMDSPGFYIYIRMPDETVWSPSFRPVETPLDSFRAVHSPGRTTFEAEKDGLKAELSFFVCPDRNILVWDLSLENTTAEDIEADIFAYAEFSQFNFLDEVKFGYYRRHSMTTDLDNTSQAVVLVRRCVPSPLVCLASSLPVKSWTGNRDEFNGIYRDEKNPLAVEQGRCPSRPMPTGEPCGAQPRGTRRRTEAECVLLSRGFRGIRPGL